MDPGPFFVEQRAIMESHWELREELHLLLLCIELAKGLEGPQIRIRQDWNLRPMRFKTGLEKWALTHEFNIHGVALEIDFSELCG